MADAIEHDLRDGTLSLRGFTSRLVVACCRQAILCRATRQLGSHIKRIVKEAVGSTGYADATTAALADSACAAVNGLFRLSGGCGGAGAV